MITIEAIPYSNFKEKLKITKELVKSVRPYVIEVFPNFIYIQKGENDDRGLQGAFEQH